MTKPTRPFVNLGFGVHHSYYLDLDITRPVFGAGVGARYKLSKGHGFLRGEVRYDRLPEKEVFDGPAPAADIVSIKLGFDLLLAE